MQRLIFLIFWVICLSLLPGSEAQASDGRYPIRIGVLAKRGAEKCLERWGPTARYLDGKIPEYAFDIIPLDFNVIYREVAAGRVDFVLANPAMYVELEHNYHASRIATLKNLLGDKVATTFCGVIFTRSDRQELGSFRELRETRFMAVDPKSFGGWHVVWYELLKAGMNPKEDFASLSFGGTHDAVVYAVRDGEVDAGCVRTDTLERMAMEGKIDLADFKVFPHRNPDKSYPENFPFLHSTDHYPEWPFAKLPHVSSGLAEKVAMALLAMPADSEAARLSQSAGWTIPLSYRPVHDCLKELAVGPYESFGKVSHRQIIEQHWPEYLLVLALFSLIFANAVRVRRLNTRLCQAKDMADEKINELFRTEKRLKGSEGLLRGILSSIRIGVVIIDPEDHRIAYANEPAVALLGFPRNKIIGQLCYGLICPVMEGGECPITSYGETIKNAKSVILTARGEVPVLKTVSSVIIHGRRYLLDSFQDISEMQRVEEELARRSEILAVRVKELHCLYGLSRTLEKTDASVEMLLKETLLYIPNAWQYPEIVRTRVRVEETVVCSENFAASSWSLVSPIVLFGKEVGVLEVFYLEARPERDEGPFLQAERNLLDNIARRLGSTLERKKAEQDREFFRNLVDEATDGFFVVDPMTSLFLDVNARGCQYLGYERRELRKLRLADVTSMTPDDKLYEETFSEDGHAMLIETTFVRKDGSTLPVEVNLKVIRQEKKSYLVILARDITSRKKADQEKSFMEAQLLQSEKMAAVGQLSAGVAHEINNPTGFVSSNLTTMSRYVKDIKTLTDEYRKLAAGIQSLPREENGDLFSLLERLERLEKDFDVDFILEDIGQLVAESQEGTERIRKIVQDLKDFAHPGEETMKAADINAGLDSTLNVVWNEIKYKATVDKDYGELPLVKCYPQQINQVFMNLLVNAAQAIEEKGVISMKTRADDKWVRIWLSDTGKGIPERDLKKIFDPFFTTKEVGKGTGLGLNVAYNIIKKHRGSIEVSSTVGKGTSFVVTLPRD